MKPTPKGWPRLSQSIFYSDPAAAIDWLCDAFGFELRLKVEGDAGEIVHSELTYGEALVMIGGASQKGEAWLALVKSPKDLGGAITQSACLFVDDVDGHCAHARQRGARIVREPTTSDYGDDYWTDRSYGALDPEGHLWWFMQRLRSGKNG
jgi:uncharacterized glyoxalase superfamily protein PhnB